MNYSLITVITILGICLSIASCKKSEERTVERVEDVQKATSSDFGLVRAMKKATMAMKRLSRGVKHNDWVEIDIWTQEIKEGIGDKCVELYEAENNGVPNEFIALQNKFLRATKNLLLCSQDHDTTNAKLEFDRLKESCDECHAIFNEEVEDELELENLTIVSETNE